jgi:predicted sulfurtransferase
VVLPVKELVFYGIDNEHTLGMGGVHLEPADYHKKLAEAKDDTVVIDVRNGYTDPPLHSLYYYNLA